MLRGIANEERPGRQSFTEAIRRINRDGVHTRELQ